MVTSVMVTRVDGAFAQWFALLSAGRLSPDSSVYTVRAIFVEWMVQSQVLFAHCFCFEIPNDRVVGIIFWLFGLVADHLVVSRFGKTTRGVVA